MSDTLLDRIKECELDASRVNPDSPHRRELRRILGDADLAVAAVLLFADRVAMLDESLGPIHLHGLVHDARAVMEPFMRYARA